MINVEPDLEIVATAWQHESIFFCNLKPLSLHQKYLAFDHRSVSVIGKAKPATWAKYFCVAQLFSVWRVFMLALTSNSIEVSFKFQKGKWNCRKQWFCAFFQVWSLLMNYEGQSQNHQSLRPDTIVVPKRHHVSTAMYSYTLQVRKHFEVCRIMGHKKTELLGEMPK